MKRDMDLARSILLQVEEAPSVSGWVQVNVDGRTDEEVSYHIMMLAQAGFLEATNVSTLAAYRWRAKRLTWQGHEFLEKARNERLWARAKAFILERGGNLTFDVMKAVLEALMKEQIGVA